jgi:hypothetical protein
VNVGDDDCGDDNVGLEEGAAGVYHIIRQYFYNVFVMLFG